MRQAGQSGACVNAPCALLFLRPSKLNNLSFVDYWTDVANFPRFYLDVKFCPTYIDLDGRGARPRAGAIFNLDPRTILNLCVDGAYTQQLKF